jgi:hypothetical protein
MFGFLKPRRLPEGPYQFVGALEIERPAEHVFPLIDLADPRYAKRQLGESVEEVEGRPGTYRLVLGEIPDLAFELTVTEREPQSSIGFACTIAPRVGRLGASHELYRLEPLGPDRCRLELVNTVTFSGRLSEHALVEETTMLTVSVHNALAKIKLHAEGGVAAVRAVERDIVVGLDCEA